MRIELIVIGNEVLNGFTVNTNAVFIGQHLIKEGYVVNKQTIVPDNAESILAALSQALEKNHLVVTTGGLGPTIDDITRKVAAKLFETQFVYDETVASDIRDRFRESSVPKRVIRDQATVPAKAKVLLNPVGTAPGFILKQDQKALIMLPGVPSEMKPMFTKQVMPYIIANFPLENKNYRKILHLFELPEVKVDPYLRKLDEKYPDVSFSIYPGLGTLSVHMYTEAASEEVALKILNPAFSDLERQFATNCFSSGADSLEKCVQQLFVDNQWTLSAAESCTGGLLSSRLTRLPGASQFFQGSIICYANEVKTNLLGVSEALIAEKGAVSREVAEQMIQGILQITGSDFALAVSGIAGPEGGSEEKPIGTVWCVVARNGEAPHTWKLNARGNREMILTRSVNSLLSNLLLYTKETSLL